MLGVRKIQREGQVKYLVAHHLADLSTALAGLEARDDVLPVQDDRGDRVHHGGPGLDPRELPPRILQAGDIVDPYGHIDLIRLNARNFR
jgi:error-prone DNA polymerase